MDNDRMDLGTFLGSLKGTTKFNITTVGTDEEGLTERSTYGDIKDLFGHKVCNVDTRGGRLRITIENKDIPNGDGVAGGFLGAINDRLTFRVRYEGSEWIPSRYGGFHVYSFNDSNDNRISWATTKTIDNPTKGVELNMRGDRQGAHDLRRARDNCIDTLCHLGRQGEVSDMKKYPNIRMYGEEFERVWREEFETELKDEPLEGLQEKIDKLVAKLKEKGEW